MSVATAPASPAWSPEQVPVTLITDLETARKELSCLTTAKAVAIDTETVIERDAFGVIIPRNLDVEGPGEWRVMSIAARFEPTPSFPDGEIRAWVIDVFHVNTSSLLPLLRGIRPFAWNANFDRFVLKRGGIPIRLWWDGMLGAATLNQGAGGGGDAKKHMNLAHAVRKYLGYDLEGKSGTRLNYKSGKEQPNLTQDEIMYAAIDAISTLEVCRVIGGLLREAGLVPTFVRECDGQSFIEGMTRHGLPMDGDGYRQEVEIARGKAHAASERIAVATTGREMLSTLVRWAVKAGKVAQPADADLVDTGLDLMHNDAVIGEFVTAVRAQVDQCRAQLGALTGSPVKEDLFSDNATFVKLPFDPDNDTEIRRWLSGQAPHFAADFVLAAREGHQAGFADQMDTTELLAKAGTKRKLTAANDLDEALATMTRSAAPDVTENLRQIAITLLTFRRYQRIVREYGEAAAAGGVKLRPDWNHNSGPQVADMFNRFFPEVVKAYTQTNKGEGRLLGKGDAVDKDALKLMGGELAAALLEFRKWEKIVSTYGDELLAFIHPDTGRIHARYDQALTGTGRLNSSKPNAQNFSPLAKPYFTPPRVNGKVRRVLVASDLSQAELRFVADQAQDENMLSAFRAGEDLHERTATLMFGLDMKALKANGDKTVAELVSIVPGLAAFAAADPALKCAALYKTQRTKAKSVAFGYAYGLKGASLANQLTVNGVPTTKEEADELLAKFDVAYPQVAAWMAQRVAYIDALSSAMRNMDADSGVDFQASWKLHLLHTKSHSMFKKLSKELERTPTSAEVAEGIMPEAELVKAMAAKLGADPTAEQVAQEKARRAEAVTWALAYDHPVMLRTDGQPWSFESRTVGGRRRLFPVRTGYWVMALIEAVSAARNPQLVGLADAWAEQHNAAAVAAFEAKKAAGNGRGTAKTVSLTKLERGQVKRLRSKELEKEFEDRAVRDQFASYILNSLTGFQLQRVMRSAMADNIRRMGNQFRNHPIQGGVADAILIAFARIDADLAEKFPTAVGIQSVHDSIVVECDVEDAAAIQAMVKGHMQDALAEFCPSVPCVADADIQLSLDDKTKVSEEQLEEMISDLALAA